MQLAGTEFVGKKYLIFMYDTEKENFFEIIFYNYLKTFCASSLVGTKVTSFLEVYSNTDFFFKSVFSRSKSHYVYVGSSLESSRCDENS